MTVAGSALLFVVIGAGTASAESGYKAKNVSGGPPPGAACAMGGWAEGCYEARGDKIWVRDTRSDGHYAAVYWWLGDGASENRTCRDHHGKAAGWTVCDGLSGVIAEHDTITIWPVTMEGSRIVPNGASPQTIAPTS